MATRLSAHRAASKLRSKDVRVPPQAKKVTKKPQSRKTHFKSVPIYQDTYAKLSMYRIGSLSFNDVLVALMNKVSPEQFHKEYLEWQKRVLDNMEKSGDFERL